MRSIIESCGGRKMFVFLLMFVSITIMFALKYKITEYAMAMSPFVSLLVIGNLSEHKIKKGKDESKS